MQVGKDVKDRLVFGYEGWWGGVGVGVLVGVVVVG